MHEMMDYLQKFKDQHLSVDYPLYPTDEMDADTNSKWEDILDINLKEGGSFFAQPE